MFTPIKQIKTYLIVRLNSLKRWLLNLFGLVKVGLNQDAQVSNREETVKALKQMAFVIGMTKSQIENDLRKALNGAELNEALVELDKLFGDNKRATRAIIRAGRAQNGISYTKALKKSLK